MPRSEYLKHFVHDANGSYAGTEEERVWTAEQIDAEYGKYWEWGITKWTVGWDEETGGKVMVTKAKGI